MTMVTIARQSSSNVEAEGLVEGGLESGEEPFIFSAKDRGGSEATGQKGRKQACMCVNERVELRGCGGGGESGSCGHEF